MKKTILFKTLFLLGTLLIMTACSPKQDGYRTIINEQDKTITVIEDENEDTKAINISVEKIEHYENVAISDWFDEETVVVSKENESLEKMRLEELADSFPRSLYLFNIVTKEYTLLKEEENQLLGGGTLSPDKKYLLYSGITLGDPMYYMLNMDSLDATRIYSEDTIGIYSARWGDDGTIVGNTYRGALSGGAYSASTSGEIVPLSDLNGESIYDSIFIIRKFNNRVYYNTISDTSLMMLNLDTSEKVSLNFDIVYNLIPSSDSSSMLVLQSNGVKRTLILCDIDGENKKSIAEGMEINGISWSKNQRFIAYCLKAAENGATSSDLYIYDILTGESTQIVVGIDDNPITTWSPSGNQLVYTEWDMRRYKSSIVYMSQLK